MINQYVVQKTLGKGTFATVKQCKDSKTGSLYALKQMNKDNLLKMKQLSGKTAYDCVHEEMKVLQRLDHPNIMWLYEIIDDPNKKELYLVTEFYSKGSLNDKVNKLNSKHKHYNDECRIEGRFSDMITVGLDLWEARLYLIDMLKALSYCHQVIKVIHRDIKPENIMINHNNEAVLIDFGVSAIVDQQENDQITSNMGSYMFFAPEMFTSSSKGIQVRGQKTDLWALGVTLYYMLCGQYPFETAKNKFHVKELVTEKEINFDLIKNEQAGDLLK